MLRKKIFLPSILIVTLLVFIILYLIFFSGTDNYDDPDGPIFQGNFAGEQSEFDQTLKIVSYNVKFAEDIDTAIQELGETEALKGADIILLQEMDEVGIEEIARALNMNYVYSPATIHPRNDKNFGNAILSTWPLTEPGKLILPHQNPSNKQIRTVTTANVNLDELVIPVYSAHTETFLSTTSHREDQIRYLIDQISPESQYVVVGGDFNTATPDSLQFLEDEFGDIDLILATADTGYTAEYALSKFTLDHILTRGMSILESGKVEEAQASDHRPVWAEMTLD